ncbi:MAG TPA: hypothetical protein DCM86_20400 [Verrucomicrobiales bacterium]|nr:hypothetical protein [Verrucomicrobiales bacterium]
MRSLRVRLAVWFTLSFLTVTVVFTVLTYHDLDLELRRKTFEREYNINPNWILHGSYSEEEVRAIMTQLLISSLTYSLPLVVVMLVVGYFVARKSLRPIVHLNQQLQAVSPRTLEQRVALPEADEQLRDLVRHLNDMLGRLQASFAEMSEYAAKVAHELRTPLTILRLKVDQAGQRIDPGLSEELQEELHRLAYVVDQSLLIAKAEQGRLLWQPESIDLAAMLVDLARDFHLLAAEEGRSMECRTPGTCRITMDPRYCRQIIHALLTNSLVHGRGAVRIRLRARGSMAWLMILNEVRPARSQNELTLGLGLRVVRALLSLQPGISFRQHHGVRYHATLMGFSGCEASGSASLIQFSKSDQIVI